MVRFISLFIAITFMGIPSLHSQALEPLQQKDFPLGIYELRKILAQDPFHHEAWESLTLARKDAQTRNPGGSLLWNYPIAGIFFALGGAAAGIFAYLGIRSILRRNKQPTTKKILLASILTVTFFTAGLVWNSFTPELVVLKTAIQSRKGDGEHYPLIPGQKWRSGQELWVWENRQGWLKIQMGQSQGWIPQWACF